MNSKFEIRIGFCGILTENIRLDSKTLLKDSAQLWQYWLWSFKSGDTKLVGLESKLQFRILTLKLELELI